jgi:hypothetical protein
MGWNSARADSNAAFFLLTGCAFLKPDRDGFDIRSATVFLENPFQQRLKELGSSDTFSCMSICMCICANNFAPRAGLLDVQAACDLSSRFIALAPTLSSWVGLDLRPPGAVNALVLSIVSRWQRRLAAYFLPR